MGKQYKASYISLTTNANLLNEESIDALLKAGLNEFAISLHGATKETYENFMKKASYEKFHNALNAFSKLKEKYNFKVRINYTFNKDNFHELKDFLNYFNGESFDVLQIRPIQKIGNTEYNDFYISTLQENYTDTINIIKSNCKENNITLLAPNSIPNKMDANESSLIFDYTFCYISPNKFWEEGFNWREESFNEYSKKISWASTLFANIFKPKSHLKSLSNRLNHEVEFN